MIKATKANQLWIVFSLLCVAIALILQWQAKFPPFFIFAALMVVLGSSRFILSTEKEIDDVETKEVKVFKTSIATERFEFRNNIRNVGLKLQGLGQLKLAFEKFKQCTKNHDTANLLYNLATDFEVKGKKDNAKEVLRYIQTFSPNYKDIEARLRSFENAETKHVAVKQDSKFKNEIQKLESELDTLLGASLHKKSPMDSNRVKLVSNDEQEEVNDAIIDDYPSLYGSRYKVTNTIGSGTTGAVFKGKDITEDRLVAIKVLNLTEELDPHQLDEYKFRFEREIETAGNLDHVNIVKIYDAGETDGFAYIVMEYVDSENLRKYARGDELLHPRIILKLIAQCADALAYAHRQNVIHRDIKPANLLYNPKDGYIKLTDFGIAKIPDSTRTRAGSILGTPLYMSPEQLAGEELDVRSDLYSLGVTLYHLLTGSPPFRPKNMAELMRSITQEKHKDILEINPDTPSCIAWAVNKALEKDPDKRFQSAASMANKLRECEMMLDG